LITSLLRVVVAVHQVVVVLVVCDRVPISQLLLAVQ
jgi:hypothetical protein